VYAITILRAQYTAGYYDNDQFVPGTVTDYVQAFKEACKEQRYTVRDFHYDSERAGKLDKYIEQLSYELKVRLFFCFDALFALLAAA
jgi:V-type H+-transporting ATPase subunit C